MKYLANKGLCGLDLWVQCFTIATVQIVSHLNLTVSLFSHILLYNYYLQVSSFMLMLLAVVRMLRPQSFIPDWTLLSADPHIKNALLNENDQMAIERKKYLLLINVTNEKMVFFLQFWSLLEGYLWPPYC